MKENVIQVSVSAPDSLIEPVIALLAEVGYVAFEETASGVEAFIGEPVFDSEVLVEALSVLQGISYEKTVIPPKNWNAEWEANFQPVRIGQFCQIIPSFLVPAPEFTHTVLIEPKMAFGTGHHETTRLMVKQLEQLEVQSQEVLDMGCGTGILGILSLKMGAKTCLGIDIDPWSIENSRENGSLNAMTELHIQQGGAESIPDLLFDLILANINRNVLLQDIPRYAAHLRTGGNLILSGFYTHDEADLKAVCTAAGLVPKTQMIENDWCSLRVEKQL